MSYKWVTLAVKSGKELVRDKRALFFMLLFPVIFIVVFGFAFGTFTGENEPFDIAIINYDEGVTINLANGTSIQINHGNYFIKMLTSIYYEDAHGRNTTKMFNLRTDVTEAEAQALVEARHISLYIIIPENFSQGVQAEAMRQVETAIASGFKDMYLDYFRNGSIANASLEQMIRELMRTYGSNATDAGYYATDFLGIPEYERAIHTIVTIRGDPGYMRYNAAKGIIEALMSAYIQAVSAKVLAEVQPYLPEGINIRLHEPHVVTDEAIVGVSTLSVFDYQVPGLMVFAILMGITGVAVTLTVEVHNKTLERLKITKMRAFDLMFGTLIPFTALSALQILILFFVALLMGYHWHPAGNPGFAILIGMLAAIASVALGLILASFAKNENQAATLGPMIAVPTAFLTGAFFPLPKVMLTDNFFGTGKPFYLFDWLPWTQASYAIMQILTFGKPITALYFELVLMIILIVIFFTIGVVLYSKKRLKSSD